MTFPRLPLLAASDATAFNPLEHTVGASDLDPVVAKMCSDAAQARNYGEPVKEQFCAAIERLWFDSQLSLRMKSSISNIISPGAQNLLSRRLERWPAHRSIVKQRYLALKESAICDSLLAAFLYERLASFSFETVSKERYRHSACMIVQIYSFELEDFLATNPPPDQSCLCLRREDIPDIFASLEHKYKAPAHVAEIRKSVKREIAIEDSTLGALEGLALGKASGRGTVKRGQRIDTISNPRDLQKFKASFNQAHREKRERLRKRINAYEAREKVAGSERKLQAPRNLVASSKSQEKTLDSVGSAAGMLEQSQQVNYPDRVSQTEKPSPGIALGMSTSGWHMDGKHGGEEEDDAMHVD